jgi:hypothetical protein
MTKDEGVTCHNEDGHESGSNETHSPGIDDLVEALLNNIASINIDADILHELDECHGNPKDFFEKIKDPNLIIFWRALDVVRNEESFTPSNTKDANYHNALINFLRINLVLFKALPWWRSRMGWFLWFAACYANPESYYQMVWEDHFDPRNWYHAGEKPRRVSKESERDFILD